MFHIVLQMHHFKLMIMLDCICLSLWMHLHLTGVVQGGHPPSGPRGLQLGGSRSAQGGGSAISRSRRPAVGFTLGWEPAGAHRPQPGQPDRSVLAVGPI